MLQALLFGLLMGNEGLLCPWGLTRDVTHSIPLDLIPLAQVLAPSFSLCHNDLVFPLLCSMWVK